MRTLLDGDHDACRADGTGQTALHWTAVRGSLLAAEALLGNGADLRLRDGRGYTACHVAAQYGQTAFIYMVALRWHADVDRCSTQHLACPSGSALLPFNISPLIFMIRYTSWKALLWEDDRGFFVSSPDVDGRTPLHWASYKGYANTLRLLIVLEASLTLGDREGCTPLHWSAIRGNSEACTVLLQVQTFKSG